MEGTAKGGGALSACSISRAPVMFIGVGEKLEDLERFNPKGFVGRLLGMGDIEALLEKAQEAITEEDAQDLGKKFLKGEFSLLDLYEQMEAMKKMGPLSKVMEMIPGMGQLKMPKEMLDVQEGKLKKWKIAMDSMTKAELEDPEIMNQDRMDRISKGSGVSGTDIREMIKQYRQSKKMMKQFKNPKQMERMMKRIGSGGLQMK
jgi:signal recognition particle subunit SRP54